MKNLFTIVLGVLFSLLISSKSYSQEGLLNLCNQHIVQAGLPYSVEREQRMQSFDIEQKAIQEQLKQQPPTRQVYKIPVVFHIVHYNGDENISNEQIYDAMKVLNRDFRKLNADTANVDFEFNPTNPNPAAIPADIEIEFVLATKAPDGTCFNGITRTVSPTTFSTKDGFVQLQAVMNGNDVFRGMWPAKNYMNIIVVLNLGSAAGYTFLPASFNSDNMYGSIWLNPTYVGRIGTGSEVRSRTLTHEVGHWLNLYHTWGPTNNPGLATNCDEDDDVLDTPNTVGVTSCKYNENTCGPKANVENYMDYSYCSKMFTEGQKDRMRASLLTLQRKFLCTPDNQVLTGIDGSQGLCAVEFSAPKESYCVGEQVTFDDYSTQGQTSWNWEFEGGTPATSSAQHPSVTYAIPGKYKVKLTVGDGITTLSKTKEAYVHINAVATLPYFEGFEYYTDAQEIENVVIRNITPEVPTFEIVNSAAATDAKSLCYFNYYTPDQATNEFISPMFDLSSMASSEKMTLSFKFAYRKKKSDNNEKLTIYASKDCGTIWQKRNELSGSLLSSLVVTNSFVPVAENFKTVHVTGISSAFFTSNFQFKIAFQSNGGNNLYLDDINLYKGTPSDVNIVGISSIDDQMSNWNVSPNPTTSSVFIAFSKMQSEETHLRITDVTGKIVFENTYQTPQGENEIIVDVTDFSSGIYIVYLGGKSKKLVIE